ncbi:hypothetical protein O3M35_010198 [Rhynocoris fuscipes]|uniref:Uncharacterized protein n=1 Tax=Rhynocoris fuscipes TaxID=488301 RepID=A0AAW1CY07_9HEMI
MSITSRDCTMPMCYKKKWSRYIMRIYRCISYKSCSDCIKRERWCCGLLSKIKTQQFTKITKFYISWYRYQALNYT